MTQPFIRRIAVAVMLLVLLAGSSVPGFANAGGAAGDPTPVPGLQAGGGEYVPGEVLVKFKNGVSGRLQGQLLQALSLDIQGVSQSGVHLAKFHGTDLDRVLAALRRDPSVEYAEPNYIMRAMSTGSGGAVHVATYDDVASDTYRADQWSIDTTNLIAAWGAWYQLTNDGANAASITVAVVDEGVDASHEDLVGRVDTEDGYDFVDDDGVTSPQSPDETHGTHVAGIIAATLDNGKGIAGAAGPADVKILPVRVLGEDGSGTTWTVAQGIRYAAETGARVINLSLGGQGYSQTLADAVAYAQSKGALVVAAAGNDASDVGLFYPAALPGVLTVAATNQSGDAADFSNYGQEVDVAAPGVDILSTVPEGYDFYSGTSMAAPLVSGVAALLMSMHADWSGLEVERAITSTATGTGHQWTPDRGYGIVDAGAAAAWGSTPANPSIQIVSPADGTRVSGQTEVRVLVDTPSAVSAVDFAVDGNSVGAAAYNPDDPTEYRTTLNVSSLAPGTHTITATALNSDEQAVASDAVTVQVVGAGATGLQIKVLDPAGHPAVNAYVRVLHPYAQAGSAQQWVDDVSSGYTNQEGVFTVSNAAAPDGETYLIYVNGMYEESAGPGEQPADVSFHYERTVTSPASIVMDGTGTVKVDVATDVAGAPVPGGALDIYPVTDAGTLLDNGWAVLGDSLLLDEMGAATVWLAPGSYVFNVSDGQTRNVWVWQNVTVAPSSGNAASVTINPETSTLTVDNAVYGVAQANTGDAYALLYPRDPNVVSDWVPVFDSKLGQAVVMPGTYDIEWATSATDGENVWQYWMYREGETFTAGDGGVQLSMGQTLDLTVMPDWTDNGPAQYPVRTTHEFTDGNGNRLIDVYVTPLDSNLALHGTYAQRAAQGQGTGAGASATAARPRLARLQRGAADVTPQYIDWGNPNGHANPTVAILDSNDQIVADGNDGYLYWYDPSYYTSFEWTPDPLNLLTPGGEYKLKVALDLAKDGSPWQASVEKSVTFTAPAAGPTAQISLIDPYTGQPYSGSAYVEIDRPYQENGTVLGYMEVASTDDGLQLDEVNGVVYGPGVQLQAGDVVVAGGSASDGAATYLYHAVTQDEAEANAISVDAWGTSRKVTVNVNGGPNADGLEQELVLNGEPVTTLVLSQGSSPSPSVDIYFTEGGSWNLLLWDWAGKGSANDDYFLTARVDLTDSSSTKSVTLDYNGAVPLAHTFVPGRMLADGTGFSLDWAQIGLGLPGSAMGAWFDSGAGQPATVRVTPGTYDITAEANAESASQQWYWTERIGDGMNGVTVDAQHAAITWGGDFSAHLTLTGGTTFKPGQTVSFSTVVEDAYGHKLTDLSAVDWGDSYITRFRPDPSGPRQQAAPRGVTAQNHNETRYPFLIINDPTGLEVSRTKDAAYLDGTASFMLPDNAMPGEWTATLLYGVDALGPSTSVVHFTVQAAGGSDGGGNGGGGNNGGGPSSGGSGGVTPPASGDQTSAKVGTDGGSVQALDGAVQLDFAPGTFNSDVNVTVTRVTDAKVNDDHLSLASDVIQIDVPDEAHNLLQPATLRLKYADSVNADDLPFLGLYRESDTQPGTWEYVGGRVDPTAGTVVASLNHFSRYALMVAKPGFSDTKGHWAERAISVLAAHGVLKGDGGRFRPNDTVTRAELAAMIVRTLQLDPALDLTGANAPAFQDVAPSAWYAQAVRTAAAAGLVKGDDGRFRPNDPITREELTAIFVRALGLEAEALGLKGDALAQRLKFNDAAKLPAWAKPYVAAASDHGVVNGIGGGAFGAGARATRAEAATLLERLANRLALLMVPSKIHGTLGTSELEGFHYVLETTDGTYVLLVDPNDHALGAELAGLVGQTVDVTGYPHTGPTVYQQAKALDMIGVSAGE